MKIYVFEEIAENGITVSYREFFATPEAARMWAAQSHATHYEISELVPDGIGRFKFSAVIDRNRITY